MKLVFRTLGTNEREKEIYVFGRPKEMQHFSGPHFYIFMGPAMIARKFTIFDQRSSKKSLLLLREIYHVSRSFFSKSVMHFRAIMDELVNFLRGLDIGCAARQELPWVDSPRQASKHAWPVLNCLRAKKWLAKNSWEARTDPTHYSLRRKWQALEYSLRNAFRY